VAVDDTDEEKTFWSHRVIEADSTEKERTTGTRETIGTPPLSRRPSYRSKDKRTCLPCTRNERDDSKARDPVMDLLGRYATGVQPRGELGGKGLYPEIAFEVKRQKKLFRTTGVYGIPGIRPITGPIQGPDREI